MGCIGFGRKGSIFAALAMMAVSIAYAEDDTLILHLTKGVAEIAAENGDTIYIFRTNASVKVIQGGVMDILLVGGGGAGGGGRGGGVKTGAQEVFPGENGTDYLGGGGGGAGGLTYKWNKGGDGGCGLAIIRYQVKPKGLLLLFR